MRVIQIRGTSGSGKTWAMRNWMAKLLWSPVHVDNRKKPLYYIHGSLAVLGHYESACGGCDNIGSAAAVYNLIQKVKTSRPEIKVIVCEGLLLSEDVKWSSQLEDLRALFLTTPIQQCISQIESRRLEAGNDKPLNTENTTKRVAVIERARVKLTSLGKDCRRCAVSQVFRLIDNWVKEVTNAE